MLLQSGFAHTQTFKSSCFNRTVDLWNSLPGLILSINSFNSFKVSLRKHLLEYFTSRLKINGIYTSRMKCTKCHEQSNLALNSACHKLQQNIYIFHIFNSSHETGIVPHILKVPIVTQITVNRITE